MSWMLPPEEEEDLGEPASVHILATVLTSCGPDPEGAI